MRLRSKIQVSFCATFLIMLLVIGMFSTQATYQSSISMVNDSMTTSSTLAANHIAQQLSDYMNVVSLLGKDPALSDDRTNEQKMAYLESYIETYGFTSGNILDVSGVSIADGTDFSDRAYVKQALNGKANVSDITLSKYTNTYGVSVAAPIYNTSDVISGVVYFRLDINFIMDIINSITISDHSYAYLVDNAGNIIVHPNEALILNYNFYEQTGSIKAVADALANGTAGNGDYTYNDIKTVCGFSPIANTNDWKIVIAAPESDFLHATHLITNILIAITIISFIVVIIVSSLIAGYICRPINRIKDALVCVSEGDFGVQLEHATGKDEITVLQNATVSLLKTLSDVIGQTNFVLGQMANYDLTVSDMNNYPGEFNSLSSSVNSIKSTLNRLIIEVQHAVQNVDTGSRELAQATAALSQGTVSQASSIQALADNLGVVVDRINKNSEREENVNENLNNLDHQIKEANIQMQELLSAVDNIETMSSSIQKIVSTIDGIAFQTNILSLNASVEAARAGEMGSGFAVVAEEVRALAEKCAESSQRTSELIAECISYINNAKCCADSTFESLTAIVANSSTIAAAFEEISQDTTDQAAKSIGIQNEINIISDVIQTNTATVEQTAASTAVLSEQADNLDALVRNFHVSSRHDIVTYE